MNETCEENKIGRLESVLDSIEIWNKSVNDTYMIYLNNLKYLKEIKGSISENKLRFFSRFIPLTLAIALPITGYLTINKLTKGKEEIVVTREIYEEGQLPQSSRYYEKLSDAENKVYIKVIEPWNKFGERLEYTYDATSLDFDSVMDYSDYDVGKLDDALEVKRILKTEENMSEDYTKTIKQIIIETLDEETIRNYARGYWLIGMFLLYLFTLTFTTAFYDMECSAFLYFPLNDMIDDLNEILSDKEKLEDSERRLRERINY